MTASAAGCLTRRADEAALPVRREGEGRPDVLALEVREVGQDFVLAHPAGEVVEDVVDSDPEAANARLAAALPRLDGDSVAVVHEVETRDVWLPTQACCKSRTEDVGSLNSVAISL